MKAGRHTDPKIELFYSSPPTRSINASRPLIGRQICCTNLAPCARNHVSEIPENVGQALARSIGDVRHSLESQKQEAQDSQDG